MHSLVRNPCFVLCFQTYSPSWESAREGCSPGKGWSLCGLEMTGGSKTQACSQLRTSASCALWDADSTRCAALKLNLDPLMGPLRSQLFPGPYLELSHRATVIRATGLCLSIALASAQLYLSKKLVCPRPAGGAQWSQHCYCGCPDVELTEYLLAVNQVKGETQTLQYRLDMWLSG